MSVIIPVFAMHTEILNGFGAILNKEFNINIPKHCMDNSILIQPLNSGIFCSRHGVLFGRFLVEYVSANFTITQYY